MNRLDKDQLLLLIPPGSRWVRARGKHQGRKVTVVRVNESKVKLSLQEKGTYANGRSTGVGHGNYQTHVPLDHFMTMYDPLDTDAQHLGPIEVHRWHTLIGIMRCSCAPDVRAAAEIVQLQPAAPTPVKKQESIKEQLVTAAAVETPGKVESPLAEFPEALFPGKMTIAEERELIRTYLRYFNDRISGNWWSDLLKKFAINYRQGGEILDRYKARPSEQLLLERERDSRLRKPGATGLADPAQRAADAVRTLGEKSGQPIEMRTATPAPAAAAAQVFAPVSPQPAPARPIPPVAAPPVAAPAPVSKPIERVAAPPPPAAPAPVQQPEPAVEQPRAVVVVSSPLLTAAAPVDGAVEAVAPAAPAAAPITPLPAPPREKPGERKWIATVMREVEVEVSGATLLDALAKADVLEGVIEVVGVVRARPR